VYLTKNITTIDENRYETWNPIAIEFMSNAKLVPMKPYMDCYTHRNLLACNGRYMIENNAELFLNVDIVTRKLNGTISYETGEVCYLYGVVENAYMDDIVMHGTINLVQQSVQNVEYEVEDDQAGFIINIKEGEAAISFVEKDDIVTYLLKKI